MIDVSNLDLAGAMRESDNYKIIRDDGWLYVFPADLDFEDLADQRGGSVWDHRAVLRIDERGNVRHNRFGPVTDWFEEF